MTEFQYTLIPVNPGSKNPALSDGFKYTDFAYGGDYRNGDHRQAGHVTHPNASLFVIDVDSLTEFLDTYLGKFLAQHDLLSMVTYASTTDSNKKHLYFADPEFQFDPGDFPGQWSSKFAYDVKSNGFVRAEPAYTATGREPFDLSNAPLLFLDDMKEAIEADKQIHRDATRKPKPERQGEFMPGSGDLSWSDWHYDDGVPVNDFTCDYEDALRIAGQLRNYYEDYEDGLREFCTVVYESAGYTGDESWAETFDRLWYSMEPSGGMSIEERQRREEEMLDRIDPDGSGREYAVSKAQERYEYNQAYSGGSAVYDYEPDEEDEEGFGSAYFPQADQAAATHMPEEAKSVSRHLIPGTPEYVETQRHFAREKAKELWAENKRQQAASQWVESGGYRDDLMDLDDPPKPTMFSIAGHPEFPFLIVENSVTVMFGARGGGKTWTAATWAEQELRYGNHVIWLDFERQDRLMKAKLDTLKVQKHLARSQFHYSDGGLPPVDKIAADVAAWKEEGLNKRILVVIDSFRDLLNAAVPDGDSNSGETVAKVYEVFLNQLHKAGATICLIDHIAKSGNGSAFGSERKESAADFVLQLDQNIAFTKTRSGYATIKVKKDRYGNVPGNEDATEVGFLWVPGTSDAVKLGYPDRPEIRYDSPGTSESIEKANVSNDYKVRRVQSVVDFLVEQGGLSGVVSMSAAAIAAKIKEADLQKPEDQRAWVHMQGKSKGEMWTEESIATKIGGFVTGKDVPEAYSGVKICKDSSGAFFLQTAADRHEEVANPYLNIDTESEEQ